MILLLIFWEFILGVYEYEDWYVISISNCKCHSAFWDQAQLLILPIEITFIAPFMFESNICMTQWRDELYKLLTPYRVMTIPINYVPKWQSLVATNAMIGSNAQRFLVSMGKVDEFCNVWESNVINKLYPNKQIHVVTIGSESAILAKVLTYIPPFQHINNFNIHKFHKFVTSHNFSFKWLDNLQTLPP